MMEVEGLISVLEAQIDDLAVQLENPPADPKKVQKMGNEYVRLQHELEQLMREWEGLFESAPL